MSNEQITTKEIYELIGRETTKLSGEIKVLQAKIDNNYVPRNELEARLKPIEDELSRFKNLVYGVIATVITLILGVFFAGGVL